MLRLQYKINMYIQHFFITGKAGPHARAYRIKHLSNQREGHHPEAWVCKGHTITIISPEHDNPSKDQLYVDHHNIHKDNWKWIYPRSHLVLQQGSGEDSLAGHIAFRADGLEAAGSMQFGNSRETVALSYSHPTYSCDMSKNTGAYVAKDGASLTLKWDNTSSNWQKATWVNDALQFTYWIEKAGKVGDQQLYQTAIQFKDNKTGTMWDVLPRGPGGSGAFTSLLDSEGHFTFDINPGYTIPKDDRSSQSDGMKTVFPFKAAFKFDQLASNITGGAMLCVSNDEHGEVYAFKGKCQNMSAVGTYSLFQDGNKHIATLSTHGQKLSVGKQFINASGISGNKLWWHGLSSDECKATGLPANGFVTMSPCGTAVESSSFGARGIRTHPTATLMAAGVSGQTLQFQDLLGMNPYTTVNGNTVDDVQQKSMEDFYKILQYYMDPKYLHNFIAPNTPDLGGLAGIAKDNEEANRKWYSTLSVPYLVQALSTSSSPAAVKLNARRAQSYMKTATAVSTVFKDQSAKLYSRQWQAKFPLMSQFLVDQKVNAQQHSAAIDDDGKKWIADIEKDLVNSTDPDDKAQLEKMKSIAVDACTNGKQGKYWAYILFRYLTSPNYLTMLRMQLIDGNTSQTLTQDIQRYSAILSILDDTSYFTQQFADVIRVYQLSSLLPSLLDIPANLADFTFFMRTILNAFVDKYVNSTDPQMAEEAKVVQEELKVNSLQNYLDMFASVAATLGSNAWANLAEAFESKALEKFGKFASTVSNMLLLSAVSFGIMFLATGTITWSELNAIQQAQFISQCVSIFVLLVRKGIQARVAYESTQSLWEAMKVFFGKELSVSVDTVTSSFSKWIAHNGNYASSLEGIAVLEEFQHIEQFELRNSTMVRYFGRNLEEFMATRFAAAMAIVGIVLSALALADSTSPLDTAMNSLFLASASLDLVAAAAGWAVSLGVESVGVLSVSLIASLASGLAIAAAVAGIIIMIICLTQHHDPPDLVKDFTESQEVKNGGYYMDLGTEIDYFSIIYDENGKNREIGFSMQPKDLAQTYYLNVNSDGSLSLGALTYGYSSVLSASTDYMGNSQMATKVWDASNNTQVLLLTFDDQRVLKMASQISDDQKKSQQQWKTTCEGDVKKDDKGNLLSASFSIYNVQGGTNYYLTASGRSISTGTTPYKWTLQMQPMKPEVLTFPDVTFSTYDKDRRFYPYLLQPGSQSGRTWSVNPSLPDWLQLDVDKGTISQKSGVAPPEYAVHEFTIKVTNDYGEAETKFKVQAIST